MLELIKAALKPFIQATQLASESQYPTISIADFALAQIQAYLEDLNLNKLKNIFPTNHADHVHVATVSRKDACFPFCKEETGSGN